MNCLFNARNIANMIVAVPLPFGHYTKVLFFAR